MSRVPADVVRAVAVVPLLASAAIALDCIDYSDLPRRLGADAAVASIGHVALTGDLALVAGRSDPVGLWVVDVSDPAQPDQVGFVPLPGTPWALTAEGHHAFVACDDAGLQVVDLSSPAAPAVVATVPTLDRSWDVAAADGVVWLADFHGGLAAIDVTDPGAPVEIARLDANPVARVAVEGSLLVAMWNGDPDNLLWTWNVADPAQPSPLGAGTASGCVWPFWCDTVADLELHENRAYALVNSSDCVDQDTCYEYDDRVWVQAWDLSDPTSPVRDGGVTLEHERNANLAGAELAIAGTRAYVSSTARKLHVIDLTDPAEPRRTYTALTRAAARGVAARSGAGRELAFVADEGLSVWNVTNVDPPNAVGGNGVDQSLHDVAMIGDVAYTLGSNLYTWPGQFTIRGWDLADPANPEQLFSSSSAGYGFFGDLEAASGDLYRAGHTPWGYTLSRAEVAADGTPGPLVTVYGSGVDSEATGSRLLVASGPDGLAVLETSPDADPIFYGQEPRPAHRVAADGDLAVVLQGDHWYSTGVIHTVDVTDPALPIFGADLSVAPSHFRWIAMRQRLVAVGGAGNPAVEDVQLVDVSDPYDPRFLASVALGGSSVDGTFLGSILYVILGSGGCVAIDVRRPADPVVLGPIPTDPGDAVVAGAGLILACEGNRLTGLPTHCAADVGVVGAAPVVAAPRGLRAAPNPFRRTTTIRWDGRARLDLYDARGRHVRRLAEGARSGPVVWDGTGAGGRRVAPGVYFLRLESAVGRATAKVVRLR